MVTDGTNQRGESWVRDYVDEVVVRVETVQGPSAEVKEVLEIRLPGETAPSQAEIASELEYLIDAETSPLFGHPYLLRDAARCRLLGSVRRSETDSVAARRVGS